MIKKDIVTYAVEKTGHQKRVVEEVANALFDGIILGVGKTGKVTIMNFGTFEKRERARKKGTHPETGDVLFIESKLVPRFRPGKKFRNGLK